MVHRMPEEQGGEIIEMGRPVVRQKLLVVVGVVAEEGQGRGQK